MIRYPDPCLERVCTAVRDATAPEVRRLIERMFELMFSARGVGLAAPQVGVTARLFVASPDLDPADRRLYVNPEIINAEGQQEGDEGCLSFPNIICKIKRSNLVTLRATDLDGRRFEETREGLAARIVQHECDHLEGLLLVDRMSSVAKLASRGALKELRAQFESEQIPPRAGSPHET